MELLQGEAFTNLFRTCQRSAFHLEMQDEYHTPEEAEPFRRFLAGEDDDYAWHQPWLDLVSEVTTSGVIMTRARIVTVPHTDYVRWSLAVAPKNIAAGEDLRWLPRHLAEGIGFPENDYWLLNDDRLVLTVFAEDGRFLGGTEMTDHALIEQCRTVRNQVWARAIPHDEYVSSSTMGSN
ncbi:MAG: hypothetical protein HKP61_08425 [Dactylosporangium sp.]|nr:hypothetical protein [Dactylosporangium sp.]NNJ60962.1 hypothetical protein [Dactylosporangium sp.]